MGWTVATEKRIESMTLAEIDAELRAAGIDADAVVDRVRWMMEQRRGAKRYCGAPAPAPSRDAGLACQLPRDHDDEHQCAGQTSGQRWW